ncbi:MAG: citrate synthase [Gemmatales bacterium]|nr:citrate synthase [Gemmatales bacterium]MDW8388076.1 citrate/2-methylcitrate synthase [Gemmatales bacterium]
MSSTTSEIYSPGLEGVIAGETAISTVTGGLRYRGYPIGELAEKTTFEEVAYLLLHGELPRRAELEAFQQRIVGSRTLPPVLITLLRSLPPGTPAMDALRTAISVLAHYDPETQDNSHAANVRKAERLLGQIPVAIAEHFRAARGLPSVASRPNLSHAANFLWMLRGTEPDPVHVRALDVSLILYAEHEFNASTFTARVIVSTLADLHSAIVGATGALKGPLHGGANEKVMDVLLEIDSPQNVRPWLQKAFANKVRIMGFGHRVYKTGDVRAKILKQYARQLAEATRQTHFESMAEEIEQIMEQEKNLMPNLDWPAGRLYHYMGLEIPLYTPIFVMSRVAGWSAHVIEQLDNNRLIRPRARYIGPELRSVVPLEQRG